MKIFNVKKAITNLLPVWLLRWHRKKRISISKFENKSTIEVFTEIYNSNHWKSHESNSGTGSELAQTKLLVIELGNLFHRLKIKSVLDIPCGDLTWMQWVDLSDIDYLGADIVTELIENNEKQYKDRGNIKFKVLNLITDPLPKRDIIIIRDCFVHFSFEDIRKALRNIKASGCKYIFTTTFTNCSVNYDIVTGDWRRLNLQRKPFNLPEPLLVLNENCTEGNGRNIDKSMALWEIINIYMPGEKYCTRNKWLKDYYKLNYES